MSDQTPLGVAVQQAKEGLMTMRGFYLPAGVALAAAWSLVSYFHARIEQRVEAVEAQLRENTNRIIAAEAADAARVQRFEAMDRRLERIEDKLDRALGVKP